MTGLWEFFVIALVGGFAGALAAGLLGFSVAREAQRREARARILRETLHALHDPLNNLVEGQRSASEPTGQPPQLGVAYSALLRDAAASSAADYRWLQPFQGLWDEVGAVFQRFYAARVQGAGSISTDVSKLFAIEQMKSLDQLNDLLKGYNDWLVWQLTRPWWWPVPPGRHRRGKTLRQLGLPED